MSTVADAEPGVTTGAVNLREGPGTGHAVITTVPAGASIEVISCEGWCQVQYGNVTGFMSSGYVELVGGAEEPEVTLASAADDQAADDSGEPSPLTEDELEILVAPIALYPDDLVALVIAASLYPVDIVQASRFLDDLKTNPDLEPSEDWDGSVISLLNYPDIVKMMSDDLDWTQMLGEAALGQQKDLLVAIQQLRDQAVATNVLQSTEQVVVTEENDNVIIQSADPEVIYVPQYEPQILYDPTYVPTTVSPIVYSDPYPSYYYPSAGFWTGIVTGAAFAAVIDWDDWGTWGGDVDIDIKRDGDDVNIDFGDRNIDRDNINIDKDKLKANKDALKNIDRSKIKAGNVDRTQIKQDLKQRDNTRVSDRKPGQGKPSVAQRPASGNDVRKNIQSGLSQRPQGGNRPDGVRASPPKVNPPSAANRAATKKPPSRPTASKAPNRNTKSVSAPKPGNVKASRPSKPSSLGSPSRGKPTKIHSSRGHKSMGGGSRGGGSRSFSGGGRGGGRGGGGRGR